MEKIIYQEFSETPKMSKWNKVPLTKENVVDYFSQLQRNNIDYGKDNEGYFKHYFDTVEEGKVIDHTRIDIESMREVENYLMKNVLGEMSQEDYKALPQYRHVDNLLKENWNYTNDEFSFEVSSISSVVVTDGTERTLFDVNELINDLKEEHIKYILMHKSYSEDIIKLYQTTDLARRVAYGEELPGDDLIIEAFENAEVPKEGFMIDETFEQSFAYELTDIQKKDISTFQLNLASREEKEAFNKFRHDIMKLTSRDDLEVYLQENDHEIVDSHELVHDGDRELLTDLKRDGRWRLYESYDYDGYNIIETKFNEIPVFIDTHSMAVKTNMYDIMDRFNHFNEEQFIQNLKEFYKTNADEITNSNYEEMFITDLISNYYGTEILKFRDEFIPSESITFQNHQTVLEIVDQAQKYLEELELFENGYFSTSVIDKDTFELEVDWANVLLTFDMKIDTNPLYLADQVVYETLSNYGFETSFEEKLDETHELFKSKMENNVEAELMLLQNIGRRETGKNGLQFDVLDDLYEHYYIEETDELLMGHYLNDVINSYINDDKQLPEDLYDLSRVILEYTQLSASKCELGDVTKFMELHAALFENEVIDLITEKRYDHFYDFDFSLASQGYLEYTKDFLDNVFDGYYSHITNDMSNVYEIKEDNSISMLTNYIFLDDENKYCIANLDWRNPQVNLDIVKDFITYTQEEFGLAYSYAKTIIDNIENGVELAYSNGTGVNQVIAEAYEKLELGEKSHNLNIPKEDIEKLMLVKQMADVYNDYHDNNLVGHIKFPDRNHYLDWYAGYENEFGEVEEPPSMTWEEFCEENLIVFEENNLQVLDDVLEIIKERDIVSEENVEIPEITNLLEDEMTKALENADPIIARIMNELTTAEKHVTKALENLVEDTQNYDVSGAVRFNLVCYNAYNRKDEQAINYLDEIANSETLSKGYSHMLNMNIEDIDYGTMTYLKVTGNRLVVDEHYKLNSQKVKEFFEYFKNIDDETKIKLMRIPTLENAAMIRDFPNEDQYKIFGVVNKEPNMKLFAEDVLAFDKDYHPIIKEIIDSSKEYLVSNMATKVLNGERPSKFDVELSEQFENEIGKFGNDVDQVEMLNALMSRAFVDNEDKSKLFLEALIDDYGKELSFVINNNADKLVQPAIMFVYVYQSRLDVEDKYLLEAREVRKFFSQYEAIENKDDIQLVLLESDGIKQNIMHKMSMSPGQKQLIEVANKLPGSQICKDDICKLDKANLKISEKLVSIKGLKVTEEVKATFKSIEKVRETSVTHSR